MRLLRVTVLPNPHVLGGMLQRLQTDSTVRVRLDVQGAELSSGTLGWSGFNNSGQEWLHLLQ